MGKPTGFLEFERQSNKTVPPSERIKTFDEFHPMLSEEERKEQAARCMECGVPFCQAGVNYGTGFSGCPLHNLVPEWNDMLYKGNVRHALARLLKTNNFPEFTGRVCPALCEAGCTCGLNGNPVTVRENELYIIEEAFSKGYIKPEPPAVRSGKRVAVIGSGPAGLAAADTLNKRGHTVDVYERDDRIGGLLMYGIPNMKLDKKAVERRVKLMAAEGVSFFTNCDVGSNVSADELLSKYDAVVLCCGACQPRDLNVSGRNAKGVYFAVDFLKSTTKSLLDTGLKDGTYISAKGLDVVVVGGGDTGNDCVGTVIRHGCNSVVQIEMLPKPPETRQENNPWPQWPRVLKTDYGQEEAIFLSGNDPREYNTTIKEIISDRNNNITAVKTIKLVTSPSGEMTEVKGSEKTLKAQMLLIAAGFIGSQNYVPKAFGISTDPRGNISTRGYQTDKENVFAAGDVRKGQSLVVWAISEGRAVAKEVDEYLMGYSEIS